MKRYLYLILAVLMIVFNAYVQVSAVEWESMNQATIEWDASTTLIDGSPIPSGSTVQYRIYMSNFNTDPDKTNPVVLGTVSDLSYTLTINTEGKYLVGISALRIVDGEEVGESEINWSDVNGDQTPNPFGFVHYLKPATPLNLR